MEKLMDFSLHDCVAESSAAEIKSKFWKFIGSVLSHRLNQNLGEFHFYCVPKWTVDIPLVDRVIRYVVSHQVQHLHLEVDMEFPNSLLSCESIKTLRLPRVTKLPESLAFTKLNSLHLKFCTFESYDRRGFLCPFANCFNLKTLNISYCCFRA